MKPFGVHVSILEPGNFIAGNFNHDQHRHDHHHRDQHLQREIRQVPSRADVEQDGAGGAGCLHQEIL